MQFSVTAEPGPSFTFDITEVSPEMSVEVLPASPPMDISIEVPCEMDIADPTPILNPVFEIVPEQEVDIDVGIGQTASGVFFLPSPDMLDDSDATYFYFGWEDVGGGWLIRRTLRADASQLSATSAGNPAYENLIEAWGEKETLSYS